MRLPTYAQHRRFCEVDGWEHKGTARSQRSTGDHHRYVKAMPEGPPLYTRVSHGSGEYQSRDLWKHILRDQLNVSEQEFWDAVDHGIAPARGRTAPQKPEGEGLPLWLVESLRHMLGLSEDEIGAMSSEAAHALYMDWCNSLDREGYPVLNGNGYHPED
jgi:hypothetical protein